MWRILFLVVSVSGSAVGWSYYLDKNPDALDHVATVTGDVLDQREVKKTIAQERSGGIPLAGVERIAADRAGHFVAEFRLNSHRVEGMIDTGATTIAMNETTARRAGVRLTERDYIYEVNTANGTIRAARAVLDDVRIGSIRISNVEAMVMDDRALDTVLIGMSFLNRLRSFSQSNNTLELKR